MAAQRAGSSQRASPLTDTILESPMPDKKALIIGAGPAGLSAAIELAKRNIDSILIERSPSAGGHGIYFACKAAESCVKCGACMAEEKIREAQKNPRITIISGARIKSISPLAPFSITFQTDGKKRSASGDALILATGFKPFDPENKPYGYKRFKNVVTHLELEKIIRETGMARRPSDGKPPDRIAFVQCVGSRDSSLGHVWCSKICCGSALRMAALIKSKRPETQVAFFYIDVQNFGKDFVSFYEKIKNEIRMIRSIPGDIFEISGQGLSMSWFDKETDAPVEQIVDMAVLSVGMTPRRPEFLSDLLLSAPLLSEQAEKQNGNGFISESETARLADRGIFVAGAAQGPMNIEDSISHGELSALNAAAHIKKQA